MLTYSSFFTLISLLLHTTISSARHSCGHHPSNNQHRRLGTLQSATTTSTLRITVDTTQLDIDWGTVHPQLLKKYRDEVIPAAVKWLSDVMETYNLIGNWSIPINTNNPTTNQRQCGNPSYVTIPISDFIVGRANTDFVLYVSGHQASKCNGILGFAGFCYSNDFDRPVAGFMNLCNDTILAQETLWEEDVGLIVHEIMHALGFTGEAYPKFRFHNSGHTKRVDANPNGVEVTRTIRGRSRKLIVTPTVVQKTREFFNCSTLEGAELEDSGSSLSAASHWDKRALVNEGMTASIPDSPIFSPITMALFEDSGWYKIKWDHIASPIASRNSVGCDWINKTCIDKSTQQVLEKDFFCTTKTDQCSMDYLFRSGCSISTYSLDLPPEYQYFPNNPRQGGESAFMDYCPHFTEYLAADCRHTQKLSNSQIYSTVSLNSRCFEVDNAASQPQKTFYCYEQECLSDLNGNYIGARIHVGPNTHTCWNSDKGKKFNAAKDNLKWTVECPDIRRLCYPNSPYMCSGHGKLDVSTDKCYCNPGFMGGICDKEYRGSNIGMTFPVTRPDYFARLARTSGTVTFDVNVAAVKASWKQQRSWALAVAIPLNIPLTSIAMSGSGNVLSVTFSLSGSSPTLSREALTTAVTDSVRRLRGSAFVVPGVNVTQYSTTSKPAGSAHGISVRSILALVVACLWWI